MADELVDDRLQADQRIKNTVFNHQNSKVDCSAKIEQILVQCDTKRSTFKKNQFEFWTGGDFQTTSLQTRIRFRFSTKF